jgi:hypothetical protein
VARNLGVVAIMNQILNFSWLSLLISAAIRFFWSSAHGEEFLQVSGIETWELYVYGISLLLSALSIWHLFFRRRCRQCRSPNVSFRGSEEVDRWVGTKKVREKLSNGQYTTRSVSTTFVRLHQYYGCFDCQHSWAESLEREK